MAAWGTMSLLAWAWAVRLLGAGIEPAADAPQPLTPEDSLDRFQLAPGFRIELAAAEPLLADPTGMAFDARGRIFVCELHGYNLDGHYDVLELNRTGALDRTVRRIPASRAAVARAEAETFGSVKLLEDSDGDGRCDRATVWAERLPPCYGLVPARAGVIVLCAPDIVYLGDEDGDGRAEVRETLFTGFGVGELWTRISNPQWGVDNWIYAACGDGSAGTIRGPHLRGPVSLGNTGFRFKPDGTQFEPVSGGTSGFGLALSDWDDRFLVSNQQHALFVAPLPYRYLARNPHAAAPNVVVNISTDGHPAQVYPVAPPDPWRLARSQQAEWVKFYGAAETTMGLVTAACAPLVYRADQFPPDYRGNHFSCECAYNLILRCRLEPSGASYTASRADSNVEFLTSTEQWFRPVNLALGPEGALYIVDMYREIIEDYSAIPRYLQQQYGLIEGHDRGRLWRVLHEGTPRRAPADLTRASTLELVQELTRANAWCRLTAQRLLLERGDRSAVGPLTALARTGPTPQARLHALYALDGLSVLAPPVLAAAMEDPHPGLRRHALRLAEPWLDDQPSLRERAFKLTADPDASVRLQLAFTLGETRDPDRWMALAELAARDGADRWMQAALLSSVPDSAVRLLEAIGKVAGGQGAGGVLLEPLAAVVGARQMDAEVGDLLAWIARGLAGTDATVRTRGLTGLRDGLRRRRSSPLESAVGRAALRDLLSQADPAVRTLAFEVAGLLQLTGSPDLAPVFERAVSEALDSSRTVAERQAALALLANAPLAVWGGSAAKLLDPRQPLDLQLAAVAALAASHDAAVGPLLLAGWNTYSPTVQAATLEALFRQQQRLPALLDALESERVPLPSIDSLRRSQLFTNPDATIRRRAEALWANLAVDPDRQEILARYQAALAGPRDPRRGEGLLTEHCRRCHSLAGQGGQVGPDLGAAKGRAEETLLVDLLQPSDQITAGYRSYLIETVNGDLFTGVLGEETATSLTLPGDDGRNQVILRKDIESMRASAVSAMPENFAELLSPRDVADLLAYLQIALGPAGPAVVTLFDDDPAFARQLHEGEGTATVVTSEPFAGAACLRVTPPQRFAARIPGWDYPIVEHPGPGQFRFLRFAWKAPQAQGVMLELAAAGEWPAAEHAQRRYYSGRNSTGWQARQVSPEPPHQWTVVSVDLWRDHGDFTLTGLAPTAMGGPAFFDRVELLRVLDPAGQPAAHLPE